MKFTPFSIKNQEFSKAIRGFDKEEVKAFLDSLSDEFERLQRENEEFSSKLEKCEEDIKNFKRMEKTLQSTLLNAQETTTKTLESAKRQNALIIKEAEVKGAQILDKAKTEAEIIQNTVFKLREEKNLLLGRIKAMIDTQAALLDFEVETISTEEVRKPDNGTFGKTNKEINVDDIVEKLL